MDNYRCRLGSLGMSSTATGSSDPGGTVDPNYSIGRRVFLFFLFVVLYGFHSFLLAFFLYFFVVFQFYCSHAEVFGKTLLHEFHIFYINTEWTYFLRILGIVIALVRECCYTKQYNHWNNNNDICTSLTCLKRKLIKKDKAKLQFESFLIN